MLPVLVEVRDAGGTNAALAETQKRTNRRDIQVQLQLVTVSHCLHFSESESEDQSNQRFRIIHEEDTVHTLSAVQIVNISFHLFPTPSELEGGPCQWQGEFKLSKFQAQAVDHKKVASAKTSAMGVNGWEILECQWTLDDKCA